MAAEKQYMYCSQCGIRLRSDDLAEHERKCKANDSQKKSSSSHGSSNKDAGNPIHEASNFHNSSSNVTHEVKTTTVKEKDGVQEIHENVVYTTYSPKGQKQDKQETAPSKLRSSKAGGSLENKDINTEESANKAKNGQYDIINGGNKSNQKKDNEHVDSKPDSTSDKEESKKSEKEDIGKHPYPTEETKQKETTTVKAMDPVEEFIQSLPELDRQAEIAYQSHQENLTPCSHCERHFTPDRLPEHERVCEERPQADKPVFIK